ncbi:hypothetical protein BSL78_27530 [Apostichopus japonicus]|uniref:Uncharacterized protein n=1 Tax=Stichopus japonicus TaxID=307972 RepID=A0A2G8JIS4_STIJA|nr:hypothetical protein BSL78_27530 [Apostichopus japonicus]
MTLEELAVTSIEPQITLEELAFNGLCKGNQHLFWQKDFVDRSVANSKAWIDSGILVVEERTPFNSTDRNVQPDSGSGTLQTDSISDESLNTSNVTSEKKRGVSPDPDLQHLSANQSVNQYWNPRRKKSKLYRKEKLKNTSLYRNGEIPDYIINCICLCFHEHDGYKGHKVKDIVTEICRRESVNFSSEDSRLLLRSKVSMLTFASRSKIPIKCLKLSDVVEKITEKALILKADVSLGVLNTLRAIELNRWDQKLIEQDYEDLIKFITQNEKVT